MGKVGSSVIEASAAFCKLFPTSLSQWGMPLAAL